MKSMVVGSLLAAPALAVALNAAGHAPAAGQEPRAKNLRPFMREKLGHAQYLIEGVAEEDFEMIRDHARALRTNAGDAQWKVSPNLTYIKYNAELAGLAEELERRAAEKDLNGVTLSYIRLTINCVDCHKFVRNNRILDPNLRQK